MTISDLFFITTNILIIIAVVTAQFVHVGKQLDRLERKLDQLNQKEKQPWKNTD